MTGKETESRKVFRRWQKVGRDGAEVTFSERLFQTIGPATGKAQLPTADSQGWIVTGYQSSAVIMIGTLMMVMTGTLVMMIGTPVMVIGTPMMMIGTLVVIICTPMMMIGAPAFDEWTVTFGTAKIGIGRWASIPAFDPWFRKGFERGSRGTKSPSGVHAPVRVIHCILYFSILLLIWQLAVANVQPVDKRIVFGQVAVHLSSTRYGALRNVGRNHAYFQVVLWLC